MDMENYAALRDMTEFSASNTDSSKLFWRWHYRALKVQHLLSDLM